MKPAQAEKVVEALGRFVEAQTDYTRAVRHGAGYVSQSMSDLNRATAELVVALTDET